jgi:tRNA(Ile)-lysidine synthase
VRGLTDFPEVEAALNRRLDPRAAAPIALALSGGGDSVALLHLAEAWAARRGRRLLALTVDHGLRAESATWTAFAGAAAKAVGADWRALYWTGPKPTTGLPAAARAARHRLLADAARAGGASVILFAHTADDVAEGDLMRAGDAPTLGRLRDWSPSPAWPEGRNLFVLRPLLGARRRALRDALRGRDIPWIDDPANTDVRYARARARMALASTETTPDLVARAISGDSSLSRLAARTHGAGDGGLTISRASLSQAPPETARRYLAIATICASGRPIPPRGRALQRLLARLDGADAFAATLAGARIIADADTATFTREPGEMIRSGAAGERLQAGQATVWDGRFEITADADLVIAQLAGSAARLGKGDQVHLMRIPAPIRPTLPAIFREEGVYLPRPFGDGPAEARSLSGRRLAAACGLISHERDISHDGMAQPHRSSYVEALALA